MNHVLTGNNIVKEISHNDHNRRILDEVSMHVKSGEFLTVMGHPAQASRHCYSRSAVWTRSKAATSPLTAVRSPP